MSPFVHAPMYYLTLNNYSLRVLRAISKGPVSFHYFSFGWILGVSCQHLNTCKVCSCEANYSRHKSKQWLYGTKKWHLTSAVSYNWRISTILSPPLRSVSKTTMTWHYVRLIPEGHGKYWWLSCHITAVNSGKGRAVASILCSGS